MQIAPTLTIFQYKPDHRLGDYDLVESCDMRMDELPMMMYLAGKVRIVLFRGLKNDLIVGVSLSI
jgi:hypothetical protein